MIEHVLLASDGSPSALAAARWVAGLGAGLPGLRVTVLHVVPDPAWMATTPDGALVLPDREVLRDSMLREAAALLRETLSALAPVAAQARTEMGAPAETIVHAAEAAGCDLIVVGRRGLNPLAQLLLGSVSARVLHLARCPVVVVRP